MCWKHQVERFCRQYLQLESTLDYPQDTFLRLSDVQDAIYSNLFADGAVEYAPPVRYRFATLKELVSRIEASIDNWEEHVSIVNLSKDSHLAASSSSDWMQGASDDIMSAFSALVATPLPSEVAMVQQKCYVTYHVSALSPESHGPSRIVGEPNITLLENRALISAAGTTGLRTWEAALHLGQYLCENPSIVKQKRVLELGAGTGYLSVLCANFLAATHVTASDGSDDVIYNLPENFYLNRLQHATCIGAMDVKWGHALLGTEEKKWNGGRPVDVVLGADITYERGLIGALVGTLLDLFGLYPRVDVYISATQRNEETFRAFLERCRQNGLVVEDQEFEVPAREAQTGPFYDEQVPIRICKVWKT